MFQRFLMNAEAAPAGGGAAVATPPAVAPPSVSSPTPNPAPNPPPAQSGQSGDDWLKTLFPEEEQPAAEEPTEQPGAEAEAEATEEPTPPTPAQEEGEEQLVAAEVKTEVREDGITVLTQPDGTQLFQMPAQMGEVMIKANQFVDDLRNNVFFEEPTVDLVRNTYTFATQQQAFLNDFTSGRPDAIANVVDYLTARAQEAVATAEQEGVQLPNPMVALANQVMDLQHPEIRDTVQQRVFSEVLPELFSTALKEMRDFKDYPESPRYKNAESLVASVQHMQRAMFGEFTDPDTGQTVRDESIRGAFQPEPRQQVRQQAAPAATAPAVQHAEIRHSITSNITKAANAVVEASIPETVRQAFDKVKAVDPHAMEDMRQRLQSAIKTAFRDKDFAAHRDRLMVSAYRAPSASRRDAIINDIVKLHENRAKTIMATNAPKIISEYASRVRDRSDATHQRSANSQKQRPLGNAPAPVQRSLTPPRESVFKPGQDGTKAWEQFVAAAMS